MKTANVYRGGQRRKSIGSIKRVAVLIAVVFVALIADTVSGRDGIQAKAEDTNQIVKSGELGNITWAIDKNGLMTLAPKEGTDGHFVSNQNWYDAWKNPWISQQDKDLVKRCNITGKIYADKMPGFFRDFHSLIEILNIKNLNTVSVTDMNSLFCGCHALKSLDLSNFDTSKVTDMDNMFSNCRAIEVLDLSNFNTSNVTSMSSMFNYCWSLESLNISNFDTSKVTDMGAMFQDCNSLTNLDVSHFNTSNVINMAGMFNVRPIHGLTFKELDVSNFDTSKVTDMSSMFSNCDCVTLDVSNFDTSNVTDMSWMFNSCDKLAILDVSHFNTSKVRDMSFMFNNCDSLTYLDLSNFDTQTILMKAKEYILKGKDGGSFVRQSSFFTHMFPQISSSKLNTIILGKKCDTLSMIKDNVIYKYGIQYAFPRIDLNDKNIYIIKQKEDNYGPYNYSFTRNKNKKYGPIDVDDGEYWNDFSYDNDFADSWKPEMAGTWIIQETNEPIIYPYTVVLRDGLTNENISSTRVAKGTTIVLPAAPIHDGYEFVSWDNKDKLTNIQSDVTVTATYKKIEKPNNNSNSSNSNTNSSNTGNNNNSDNTSTNNNANTNSNPNVNDNQQKQTIPQVEFNSTNQAANNQSNELEQTGINLPSLLVLLSAILSVVLIAYYRRRSK